MPSVADRLRQIVSKVERAKKHVADLDGQIRAFFESDPYTIGAKHNPKTRKLIYYVTKASPIPECFALIAGDAVQNLATALDHLAYQIVCSDTDDAPPHPDRIYFPIAESPAEYETRKRRRMQGARQESFDAIDSLKPYKGGTELLWALYRLNNIEKHRILLTIGSVSGVQVGRLMMNALKGCPLPAPLPADVVAWMDGMSEFIFEASTVPLKEGHEILIGAVDEEPDLKQKFSFRISLVEPGVIDSKPLIETLHQLTTLVEGIVVALTPRLKETK